AGGPDGRPSPGPVARGGLHPVARRWPRRRNSSSAGTGSATDRPARPGERRGRRLPRRTDRQDPIAAVLGVLVEGVGGHAAGAHGAVERYLLGHPFIPSLFTTCWASAAT